MVGLANKEDNFRKEAQKMDPVFFVHLEERERGCLVKMDVLHCSMFISRIQTYSVLSINCDLGGPITAPCPSSPSLSRR